MYLGTPQTTFTIYRKLAERNYRPFVWPARVPRKLSNYEGLIAPQLQEQIDNGAQAWDVTDPDRFADDDLLEREAAMGRSNFMLQFMLDTSLSDSEKFPLKCSDLVVTSVNPSTAPDHVVWCSDPQNVLKELPTVGLPGDYFYSPMQLQGEWHPYQETICSVDPSGRGTDETTAAYISQRNGFLYLHEMRAYRDGYSDKTLLDILKGVKNTMSRNSLLKLTLVMALFVNCSRNISFRPNKPLTSKRSVPMCVKKTESLIRLNLYLTSTGSSLTKV